MRFRSFKDKLPVLGSNILIVSENHDGTVFIGIVEFTLKFRKSMTDYISKGNFGMDYFPQDWYSDDASEGGEWDVLLADYWCYPSELVSTKTRPAKSG